jgi:hypothetical protein
MPVTMENTPLALAKTNRSFIPTQVRLQHVPIESHK